MFANVMPGCLRSGWRLLARSGRSAVSPAGPIETDVGPGTGEGASSDLD